jgi:hypothetical protein
MDFLTTVKEYAVEKFQSSVGFSVQQNLKESLDHYLLGLSEQLLSNYSSEVRFLKTNSGVFLSIYGLLGRENGSVKGMKDERGLVVNKRWHSPTSRKNRQGGKGNDNFEILCSGTL